MYPELDDPNFDESLYRKKELYEILRGTNNEKHHLMKQQRFVANFMNKHTPYDSLLLYHNLGSGKTCSAITIAEHFIRKTDRKVLFLSKGEEVQENFKKELRQNYCTGENYLTRDDLDIIQNKDGRTQPGDIDQINLRIARQIRRNYKFDTFGAFANRVLGQTKKDTIVNEDLTLSEKVNVTGKGRVNNLSHMLLIMDEAHNATKQNRIYVALEYVIRNSVNLKVLLLTGTPITDSTEEIFSIANLLPPTPQFPIKPDQLAKAGFMQLVKSSVGADYYEVSEKGFVALRDSLRGKISYVPMNLSLFPTRRNIANNSMNQFHFIESPMKPGGIQHSMYTRLMQTKSNRNHTQEIMISNIGIEKAELERYFGDKGQGALPEKITNLFLQDLESLSSKLFRMRNHLQKTMSNGEKSFIHSIFNPSGIFSVAYMLKTIGFRRYTGTPGPNQYVILGGKITKKEVGEYIRIFNSEGNKYGDIIKVIIGNDIVKEGVTLKEVRHIHIMSPFWNAASTDQIIGRGIRLGSHVRLPESERNVKVYIYVATFYSNQNLARKYSVDLEMLRIAERKDRHNARILRMMKQISVDCIDVDSRPGKDKSRKCDYENCNYRCDTPRPLLQDHSLNRMTYMDSVHTTVVENTKNNVKKLYKKQNVWTFPQIRKMISEDIADRFIAQALDELLYFKERVVSGNNKIGYLMYIDDKYLFTPKDEPEKSSMYVKRRSETESISKDVSRFMRNIGKEEVRTNMLYGVDGERGMEDYKIIDWTDQNPLEVHNTKLRTGKLASSFTKDKLKSFYRMLFGQEPPKMTGKQIAAALYPEMIRRNLFEIPEVYRRRLEEWRRSKE